MSSKLKLHKKGASKKAHAAEEAGARSEQLPTKAGSFRNSTGDRDWLWATALFVSVFAAYSPAWHGGILWDDDQHITRPQLRSWHGLYRIWFDLGATQQYYPLLHSAFWFEHRLWGDDTLGYHIVNIILHLSAALLAVAILRRLHVPGAWLAGGIFALHPVQVESVAWITELKNTLSAVFYLASALIYLSFDRDRMRWRYWLALSLFVLGLLSKTVVATLPAALLVVFWWQRGRLHWRSDVRPLVPFFLLGAGAGLFTAWVERKLIGAEGADFDLTILERCLIAGRAVCFYLGKLVAPVGLNFVYPRWRPDASQWWQYLYPAAVLLSLLGLWFVRRRVRGPLAAALLFVGSLFPVLGFLNVFPFLYSFVADHFQYLAVVALFALFAAGATTISQQVCQRIPRLAPAAAFGLLAVMAAMTWRQSHVYADAFTLYDATLDGNPECWMAHNNLGLLLASRSQTENARAHYERALELKPDFYFAHNNLGLILTPSDVDSAIRHFKRAIEIRPDYQVAHNNIGVAYMGIGRLEDAIAHLERACVIDPNYAEPHNNLGNLRAGQGRLKEAMAEFQAALAIDPAYAEVHANLGLILLEQDSADEAEIHLQKAIALKPAYADPYNSMGIIMAARERYSEAIAFYTKAMQLKPNYADAHNNLGLVYISQAKNGPRQVERARAEFEEAIRINERFAQPHNNLGNLLAEQNDFDSATKHYHAALQIKPDYVEAHFNFARMLAAAKQFDQAIAHYRSAVALKPDHVDARNNLGIALAERQNFDEAILHYQEALKVKPNHMAVHNNLAAALMKVRRIDEAIAHYRFALQLDPQSLETHFNLGLAFAEHNQADLARFHYRQALEVALKRNDANLIEMIRGQLRRVQ